MNFIEKLRKRIENKIQRKVEEYTLKDIDELSRILNRPREGEIVKISNIKIQENYKEPDCRRMQLRKQYYEKHKYFRATIVLDNDNNLVDGYTTYLLAKEMNFDYITIVRAR